MLLPEKLDRQECELLLSPVVTPFFIRDPKGKLDGAGFLSHRVGLTCDDSASTGAATFSIRLKGEPQCLKRRS